MTRDEVLGVLRLTNPDARRDEIALYADSYMDYREAQDNIVRNGNIVAHPRTGQPIQNPYIKVKVQAMNQLRKANRLLVVKALWLDGASDQAA